MRLTVSALVAVLLYVLVGVSGQPQKPPTQWQLGVVKAGAQDWEHDMLAKLNQARARAGKPDIQLDNRVSSMAQSHSDHMASTYMLTHADPKGSIDQRATATGIKWVNVGENIAYGYQTVDEAIAGWTSSPEHYANMVGDFNLVGFGKQDGKGMTFWTQNFIKSR
ncbi:PR-1-like protein [Martensiomyces pterosporus]|nr:PR-1-like protein [Martensiomyces pterosporus]